MKILSRIALALGLFYFLAGVIGLLVEPDSEDFKESATYGGSVAAVILLAKLGGALRTRLEERAVERKSPAIPKDTRIAVFREALLVATLLERLGSERYIQEKELPLGIEITTRRVLLDRLRKLGLRDGLEPWLNSLLLSPDGHWSDEQKRGVRDLWEYFSVLWWVMGRGELQALTMKPRYTHNNTRALFAVHKPGKLHFIAPWDVRPARDLAGCFAHRTWSELLRRRAITGLSDEEIEKSTKFCKEMQRCFCTKDSIIPCQCVPHFTTPDLFHFHWRADRRWRALTLLVEVLGGNESPSGLRNYLARYLARKSTVESAPVDPS